MKSEPPSYIDQLQPHQINSHYFFPFIKQNAMFSDGSCVKWIGRELPPYLIDCLFQQVGSLSVVVCLSRNLLYYTNIILVKWASFLGSRILSFSVNIPFFVFILFRARPILLCDSLSFIGFIFLSTWITKRKKIKIKEKVSKLNLKTEGMVAKSFIKMSNTASDCLARDCRISYQKHWTFLFFTNVPGITNSN